MRYCMVVVCVVGLWFLVGCRDTKTQETPPPATRDTAPAPPATAAEPAQPTGTTASKITWLSDLDEAMTLAKQRNKPLIVDFWATWCGPCQRMEETTWRDPKVIAATANFVMVKQDVDKATAAAQKYNIESIPNLVFTDSSGKVTHQQVGYTEAGDLVQLMEANR